MVHQPGPPDRPKPPPPPSPPPRGLAPGKPRTIWDDANMRYWRCRCVGSAGRRYRNVATAKTCEVCKDERPPRNRYK